MGYLNILDIDECMIVSEKLGIENICHKSHLFMATCVNQCGNYTCECQDTSTVIKDIYDPNKCYSSKSTSPQYTCDRFFFIFRFVETRKSNKRFDIQFVFKKAILSHFSKEHKRYD